MSCSAMIPKPLKPLCSVRRTIAQPISGRTSGYQGSRHMARRVPANQVVVDDSTHRLFRVRRPEGWHLIDNLIERVLYTTSASYQA